MYDHDVMISRPSGEGTYQGGGELAAPPDEVLYDGKADVQDLSRDVTRGREGQPVVRYDAKIFFPLTEATDALFSPGNFRLKHDLKIRIITPLGVQREGRIQDVRDLDQSLLVRWAREV